LTVNEAAEELGMSAGNLRKLVHSGKLKAIKRSERKTLIPRLSLDAYLARLNGGGPEISNDRGPRIPLRERIAEFVSETAETPEAWLGAWKNGLRPDTAENMQLAIRALSIGLDNEAVPDSTDHGQLALADRMHALQEAASLRESRTHRVIVSPRHGEWVVQKPGAARVSSVHSTQREAQDAAREILREDGGGELVTHERDGTIRLKDTIHRPDPFPPRG
jgi:excisionase family DNA binding protein